MGGPMILYDAYLGFYYENDEIDFVYQNVNGGIIGVVAEYQNEISMRDVNESKYVQECLVLTKDKSELANNVLFVTIPLFLALLKKSEHNL